MDYKVNQRVMFNGWKPHNGDVLESMHSSIQAGDVLVIMSVLNEERMYPIVARKEDNHQDYYFSYDEIVPLIETLSLDEFM